MATVVKKKRVAEVKYTWKDGARRKGDPQAIGKELERIQAVHQTASPAVIVEEAEDEGSALHEQFTWDDSEAAKRCRLAEARSLVENIRTIHVRQDGQEVQRIAFVSVTQDEVGRGYVSTVHVRTDAELHEQVLDEARKYFAAGRKRYEELRELTEVFEAIERVEQRLPREEDGRAVARRA